MKIILTQNVDGLGEAGDIVEVKSGYGRNYLVPRNLAIVWSRGAEKNVTEIKRARQSRAVRDAAHAHELKTQLEAAPVTVSVRAGEGGRLFGSVSGAAIAQAIRSAGGPAVDKRAIEVDGTIKTVGDYRAAVRLHGDIAARITVTVVAA